MRRTLALAGVLGAAALALPARAVAHGLVGRADLPIPDWLFVWGATAVLVVSFVALAALWPTPRLLEPRVRDLPAGVGRALGSRAIDVVCGLAGVALLALVIYAGLVGTNTPNANWAPTFVYVGFWLGLVPISVLFGDVFRAFNPWRALGRAVGWLVARVFKEAPAPLPYPERLGYWPAAAGLLAFGWLEIISTSGDEPRTVAVASLVYSAVTFIGMALYGTEPCAGAASRSASTSGRSRACRRGCGATAASPSARPSRV